MFPPSEARPLNEETLRALAVAFAAIWCIVTLSLTFGMLSEEGFSVALILPLIMFLLGIVFFAFSYKNTIQIRRAISMPKRQKETKQRIYETTSDGTILVDGYAELHKETEADQSEH